MGTCNPKYGYIILLVWDQKESDWRIGDGIIQDTSGDVIFSVTFKAITCTPEVGEVLDGRVIEVTSTGIQVQSGCIKCFITMKVSVVDLNAAGGNY